MYGKARWRKKKGVATITLEDGTIHQAELHWYEASGLGRKEVKIKYLLDQEGSMKAQQTHTMFVICVNNTEYTAALELRKIYQVIPDETAATHGLVRVIDESGKDYLYPTSYFIPVSFPPSIQDAILRAAQ